MKIFIPISSGQHDTLEKQSVKKQVTFQKTMRIGKRAVTRKIPIPHGRKGTYAHVLALLIHKYIFLEKALSLVSALFFRAQVSELVETVYQFPKNHRVTIREYPFLGVFVFTTPDDTKTKKLLSSVGVTYDPRLTKSFTYYYKIASQSNWRPINTFFSYRHIDARPLLRKVWNFFHYGMLYEDMFMFVNFELNSHCNRACVYCPNKLYKRPLAALRFETFKKTIDELGSRGYDGFIHYAFYGEPLLDNRLKDFLTYAKKVCPKAQNHINTNGDLLTVERYKSLLSSGADYFFITLHDGILSDKRKQFFTQAKKIDNRIDFSLPSHMIFNNRAGLVDVGPSTIFKSPCPLPSYDMEITCAGYVLPCCNDYFEKMRMGNVNDAPLMSIWQNEKFTTFRNDLQKGRRSKYDICKHCNMNVLHRSISAPRMPSHA